LTISLPVRTRKQKLGNLFQDRSILEENKHVERLVKEFCVGFFRGITRNVLIKVFFVDETERLPVRFYAVIEM